nr:reverse transcriptase domain-containing protein [Tanacetum cinerariifolium]
MRTIGIAKVEMAVCEAGQRRGVTLVCLGMQGRGIVIGDSGFWGRYTVPGGKNGLQVYKCKFVGVDSLADFIAEKPDEEGPSMEVQAERVTLEPWTLFTDGSSCLKGSGAGLILTSPKGEDFTYALRFEFDASNNEAEYEALVAGLRISEQMGVKNLIAKVPRSENKKANALSKIASTSFAHLTKQVLVETLERKSKEEREILAIVEEEGYCWMTPLVEYLTKGTLPAKTRTIKIKARRYTMVNGVLYRKLFLKPWLRCVGPTQAKYLVKEIYERSCSMHSGPRSVVAKAISLGEGIEARSSEDNRNWVEEVPHVLWAHRTMIKTSNEDTPFSLTYGTKAVIPVEIGMPSIRCAEVNQAKNDKELLLNLDILEERREKEAVREARNKAKMEKYYNAKVRSTSFRPRDFVYRSNKASHAKESGKLGPKWEGPYEVIEVLGNGAYKLKNGSRDVLPRTWNVQDLKNVIFKFPSCKFPCNVKPH